VQSGFFPVGLLVMSTFEKGTGKKPLCTTVTVLELIRKISKVYLSRAKNKVLLKAIVYQLFSHLRDMVDTLKLWLHVDYTVSQPPELREDESKDNITKGQAYHFRKLLEKQSQYLCDAYSSQTLSKTGEKRAFEDFVLGYIKSFDELLKQYQFSLIFIKKEFPKNSLTLVTKCSDDLQNALWLPSQLSTLLEAYQERLCDGNNLTFADLLFVFHNWRQILLLHKIECDDIPETPKMVDWKCQLRKVGLKSFNDIFKKQIKNLTIKYLSCVPGMRRFVTDLANLLKLLETKDLA